MKKSLSIKLLSFTLAIVMVSLSIPTVAIAEDASGYTVLYLPGTDDTIGEKVSSTVDADASIVLPECTYTREGFEFVAWHDGTQQYEAGASYTVTGDTSFVPVWKNTVATNVYYSADGKVDTNGDGISDIVNATVANNTLVGSYATTDTTGYMNLYSGTYTDITCIASGGDASATCNSVYNIYGGDVTGNIFGVSRYAGNENKVHTLNGNNTYNIYGGNFAGVISSAWKRGFVLNGVLTFNINGGKFASGNYFAFGTAQWSQKAEINGAQNFIINNKEIAANGGSLAGVDIGIKATPTGLSKYGDLIVVMNNAEYADESGAVVSANSVATHTLYVTEGKATPKFNETNALIGFDIVSDKVGYSPAINGEILTKNALGYYDIASGTTNIEFIARNTVTYSPGTEDTMGDTVTNTVDRESSIVLPECTYTREGFEFVAWHDGKQQYEAGASYTVTADTTFVPVWKNTVATNVYYSADGKVDTNGDGIADIVNATVANNTLVGSYATTDTTGYMNLYSGTYTDITCIASGGDASATCNSVYNIYGGDVTGNIFGVSRYAGNENKVHTLNGNNTYNIYGGNFAGVISSAWKRGFVLNGVLTFNINGGKFASGNYFAFGTAQWSQKAEINGAQNFIINNKEIAANGGSLAGVDIGIKATPTGLSKYGDLIVVMNNAEYADESGAVVSANSVATHTLYVKEGKATPKFNETNALIGFDIVSDKEALIPAINGVPLMKNTDGYYNIEPGTSEITFMDDVDYISNGKVIEFYKDTVLDINTVEHAEIYGKFFIGWTYEDGTSPEDASFVAGDKIYAQYIDFDLDKDFYIEGAQIRIRNTETNTGEGLRFVIRKTDAADALDINGYGSVVVPALAVGKEKLELDRVYIYDSKEYEVGKVPAEKIFAKEDTYEQYTVCITDIKNTRYAVLFAVRGYIEYTDLNGNAKVLYTDYYATNLVNVAQALLDDETVTDAEAIERCETIIKTERDRVRAKYNELEKLTLSNNYNDADLVADVSINDIYQLGVGGVSVREVLIETESENEEAVEIFQLSDFHFNYCNEEDFKEANPSIMASYNGRQWLKDGESVPNAITALEYASQGDAIVITGDVLDFMSHGAMELTRKYVWDAYPNALVTLGNHDFERRCQDNPPTPDPTSYKSRYDYLQSNWKHDVYYTSKVIKDKVMLIQLENGTTKFWSSQIEPLTNDLALAREKGYTVLVFYHIPLCTNNPDEKDVYPTRRNDTYNYNFCDNGVGNSSTTDVATISIYDLITNNADIIKGTFCGHFHSDYKTEIIAKTADGTDAVIPQYILTGNSYDGGHALKITVK